VPADEPRAELFRPAALAAHREGRTALTALPSSRRMTSAAFWAVAAAVACIAFAAFAVHVDETSVGVWRAGIESGTATVAVPIGVLDRLSVGETVYLGAAGTPPVDATVTAVLNPAPVEAARAQFGGALPATLRTAAAVALVEVHTNALLATRDGRATVHLGRRSLAAELVPALRHDESARG
jgi:hypothetical protein